MKNKGFTLIELLAVIVILAIIALIATPIILNIINNSREEADERTAEQYLHGVELAIARENLKSELTEVECTVLAGGDLNCGLDDPIKVEMENKSSIKAGGTIHFVNGEITKVTGLKINNTTFKKENGNLVKVDTSSEDTLTFNYYTFKDGTKGVIGDSYGWYGWDGNYVVFSDGSEWKVIHYGLYEESETGTAIEPHILFSKNSVYYDGANIGTQASSTQLLTDGNTICTYESGIGFNTENCDSYFSNVGSAISTRYSSYLLGVPNDYITKYVDYEGQEYDVSMGITADRTAWRLNDASDYVCENAAGCAIYPVIELPGSTDLTSATRVIKVVGDELKYTVNDELDIVIAYYDGVDIPNISWTKIYEDSSKEYYISSAVNKRYAVFNSNLSSRLNTSPSAVFGSSVENCEMDIETGAEECNDFYENAPDGYKLATTYYNRILIGISK